MEQIHRWIMRVTGRREPLELTYLQAQGLKKDWHAAKQDKRLAEDFEVSGAMFTYARIVSIEPMEKRDATETGEDAVRSSEHDANLKIIKDIDLQYRAGRSKRLATLPLERGMSLGLARMVWRAYTGKQMPKELEGEVAKRQVDWFEQNEWATQANPQCYKDLLNKHRAPTHDPKEIGVRNAGMAMVERILAKDMTYAPGAIEMKPLIPSPYGDKA